MADLREAAPGDDHDVGSRAPDRAMPPVDLSVATRWAYARRNVGTVALLAVLVAVLLFVLCAVCEGVLRFVAPGGPGT